MQLQLMAPKAPKGLLPPKPMSHEEFIQTIADAAIQRLPELESRKKLRSAKLTYGLGPSGTRGITYFSAWKNGHNHDFVGICANGEESPIQLCGTTIHELGHVLAGPTAGHGKAWKDACEKLGLDAAEAGGQFYEQKHFANDIWATLSSLFVPTDGQPLFGVSGSFTGMPTNGKFKPCPLGIGTRGGKTRGAGSGSRLRLFTCGCTKVRVAKDDFKATCNECGNEFKPGKAGKPADAGDQFISTRVAKIVRISRNW